MPETATTVSLRPGRPMDAKVCGRICYEAFGAIARQHSFPPDFPSECSKAINEGTATVVEHANRVTGYATDLAFFAHAVGETSRDLMALIGAAAAFGGSGILVPVRDAMLLRWCLAHGLRIVHIMTLMTIGLYNEPAGAYLPSVLY
jgi:hypothetical protein